MTNMSTPIAYFKKEAKKLFRQVQANDAEALARVQRVLKDSGDISLMRVQHVIAAEYGFSKWENLIKASSVELQAAISRKKLLSSDFRAKLRVPPQGETPFVSFLRGPFDMPLAPHLAAFADLMDTKTMKEQEQWLNEDARRMGIRR